MCGNNFCFTVGHLTYDNSIKVCMRYYTFCSWVSVVMALLADDDDKLCFLLNKNEKINMLYRIQLAPVVT